MKSVACLPQTCMDSITAIPWKSVKTKNKSIQFIDHLLDKITMENCEDQYISLSSTYFKNLLGSHYTKVTKPLLNHGILQSNGTYLPRSISKDGKGLSKGYMINSEILKGDPIVVKCGKKKKYQRDNTKTVTLTKAYLRELRTPSYTKIFRYLSDTLTPSYIEGQIKFNEEIEDNYIEVVFVQNGVKSKTYRGAKNNFLQLLNENQLLYQYKDKCVITTASREEIIKVKLSLIKIKWRKDLFRIKWRDVYSDRNDTNFRLDSIITTLKSELIKLLKWDKEQLVNIDLKNSQFRIFVWFLEVLENAHLGTSDFSPSSNLLDTTSISNTPYLPYSLPSNMFDPICNGNTLNPSSISTFYYVNNMLLKLLDEGVEGRRKGEWFDVLSLLLLTFKELFIVKEGSIYCLSSSYVEFKELVKKGKLYDEIAKRMSDKLNVEYNREQAKSLMFRIAFAKPGDNHLEKKLFKEWFPGIVAFINQFKKVCTSEYSNQGLNKEDSKEKGNAAFAVSLQRIESYIFIDNILSILHEKGYKALSKHDSVLCKESDKDVIEIEMRVILDEIFGEDSYELKKE